MNLLLDTHIILWIASDTEKLSAKAKSAIADENNVRYVSIASAWEVAIKLGTQKLQFDGGVSEFYRVIDTNDFYETGISRKYLVQSGAIVAPLIKEQFNHILGQLSKV